MGLRKAAGTGVLSWTRVGACLPSVLLFQPLFCFDRTTKLPWLTVPDRFPSRSKIQVLDKPSMDRPGKSPLELARSPLGGSMEGAPDGSIALGRRGQACYKCGIFPELLKMALQKLSEYKPQALPGAEGLSAWAYVECGAV